LYLGGLMFAPPDSTLPEELVDACGENAGGLCEWVYENTDSGTAAKAADWLISKPLAILLVFLGAWIVGHIARWLIRRGVRRMMIPPEMVQRPLDALGLAGSEAATKEIDMARRQARAESIGSVAAGTVVVVIWVIAFATAASIIGVELGPLIAGAGVLGVALGFGAQSLVKDCINGMFMLLEDQYGIGDTVDLGEASGTVERISLRTTVLRGFDGTVWHVPNGEIVRVGNRSQLWSMAVVDVEVAYNTDLDRAQELLEATARAVCNEPEHVDAVLEAPRVLGVESVTGEAVQLRLMVKTSPGQQWALQRVLRERIKQEFEANGIEVPVRRWVAGGQPPR
jgi:moderate conductance mechanosensitive channel